MKKVIFLFLFAISSTLMFSQAYALEINDDAPDFNIINNGEETSISKMVEDGPVLLTFYRGEWCSYCTQFLSELSDNSDRFAALGAQILAISPEKNKFVNMMDEKITGHLSLISDNKKAIMDLYNVTYQVRPADLKSLKKKEIDIEVHNGKGKTDLPVPATYVIDRNMKIRFVQFDTDYTYRANLEQINNLLKSLSSERMIEADMKLMFKAKQEMEEKGELKKKKNKKSKG